jgi:selenide,water dikinase
VRVSDDLALVQTLDFFTPIVDDPFTFGRIAAANALSDVYAMGGRPLCAMNVVCFPSKKLGIELLREVLRGGLDALREAGAPLVGGHSVEDPELKYGLSVTGAVHPRRFLTNTGARPGDRLVLTKPLGTGIVSTALKRGRCPADAERAAVASMSALNRQPAELLDGLSAHACTDVTGFGLSGHLLEMLGDGEIGVELDATALPLLPHAAKLAVAGLRPGGLKRNREFAGERLQVDAEVEPFITDLVCDPQTSGGLLVALSEQDARRYIDSLLDAGHETAAMVGRVTGEARRLIRVRR